ncbi:MULTISPECIES: PIN domain-containing protein [unclassified Microcoleus]|uniref:PIN domain-containing protein n=1 Tax=unclassified Microcoleus TaxID=2642155 RepID=UPI002FD147EF
MGQLNLPSSATIYLDTQVIIYTVEANQNYYSLLLPLWLKFQAGEIELMTSELTLLETLVFPLKNANTILFRDYEQLLLSSEIQLVPITQSVLITAANLRANTNLKTPYAIMLRQPSLKAVRCFSPMTMAFVMFQIYLLSS